MDTITIERLRDREHQLHAYCHICERWKVLNLDDMLLQWGGLAHAPSEVQCSECGQFGMLKVRRRLARRVEQQPSTVADWSLAV